MDLGASGSRRRVGRSPAPNGVFAAGPAPHGLSDGPSRGTRRLRRAEGFLIHEDTPDGPTRRLEGCQSPVWDTALSLAALLDAGVAPDDPAVLRATDWLLDKQITRPGDWHVRRPELTPGAWAFEFANDNYPDTDDTAEVIMGLTGSRTPPPPKWPPRSTGRSSGLRACNRVTAAGVRSTPTTPADW